MDRLLLLVENDKKVKNMEKSNNSISIEDAMLLLTKDAMNEGVREYRKCDYLDEYGNYVFPTKMVANEPNTAYSSPEGCNYILQQSR